MKIFLGGTCNGSKWRDILIKKLKIEYFNPVVEDWTPECQEEEIKQRKNCDLVLYAITPRMTGVYSIAEVVDDSNKQPNKTLFVIINDKDDQGNTICFSKEQLKSLVMVKNMVLGNGGKVFQKLSEVSEYVNNLI